MDLSEYQPDHSDNTPSSTISGSRAQLHSDELPSGWEAARSYHRLKHRLPRKLREQAERRAVDAIMQRARRMLRHAALPTTSVHGHFPEPGELNLDRTMDAPRPWSPQDIALSRRAVRQADVAVILDMSLSMTGEKIALIALATAILRLRLDRLSVISFDTSAHTLSAVGDPVGARELTCRILRVPAQGYTNVGAGLQAGLLQLQRSPRSERAGIILTDGVANIGRDPVPIAGRFPRLHVVQVGPEDRLGARNCLRMSRSGRGRHYRAPRYSDLPDVIKRLVRECFR